MKEAPEGSWAGWEPMRCHSRSVQREPPRSTSLGYDRALTSIESQTTNPPDRLLSLGLPVAPARPDPHMLAGNQASGVEMRLSARVTRKNKVLERVDFKLKRKGDVKRAVGKVVRRFRKGGGRLFTKGATIGVVRLN